MGKHNDAPLVGGSNASKTGLRNREESEEPPGVTQLQNPPSREGQRRERLEHGGHAASSAGGQCAPGTSSRASLQTAGTSSRTSLQTAASTGKLPAADLPMCSKGFSPRHPPAAVMPSGVTQLQSPCLCHAAQKVCVNTSDGELQVVPSNDLTMTRLYPSPKHRRVRDVAEPLPCNTAQQHARETL